MSVVLIGYRGSGKTTVGRKLADRLWQTFIDTDELITKRANKSIKDIFEQDGEEAFRDLEEQVIKEVSTLKEHVISVGGGAVLRESNRAALRSEGNKVIYLKADPKTLKDRIHADPETQATRPALTNLAGSLQEIEQLLLQREPLYRQLMHKELDVSNLTPEEACVYIVRLMA
jgi:shikimate kinase